MKVIQILPQMHPLICEANSTRRAVVDPSLAKRAKVILKKYNNVREGTWVIK